MITLEIIAQGIGIFAMAMNLLSFQQKSTRMIIGFQLAGSVLFSINFFMLGATVGAILNLIGIFRALIYMEKERFRADRLWWVFAFSAAYILTYILTFTAFGKEPSLKNLIIEALPVIGMILTTVSFRIAKAHMIRRIGMINSPLWLIYNIASFSIGAICSEIMNLISVVVAIIRFDLKKDDKKRIKNENP